MLSSGRTILIGLIATLVPAIGAQEIVSGPATKPAAISQGSNSQADETSKHQPLTVVFSEGKLMISAENCSLQEVLEAIRLHTGAIIEGAINDSSRVTVHLGPDNPMKVIASLLYGSRFNYIIVAGAPGSGPQKIVLSARGANPVTVPIQPVVAKQESKPAEGAAGAEKEVAALEKEGDKEKGKDAQKDSAEKDKKSDEDADALAKADVKPEDSDAAASEPTLAERIANLPEGINPAIAALYPNLLNGGSNSGSSGSSGGSGNITPTNWMPGSPSNPIPVPWGGGNLPTNAAGLPILPSNIPPEIWNLYPKNIMDLIRSGGSNPQAAVIPSGPLAPGLPAGPVGLWDQSLKAPGH